MASIFRFLLLLFPLLEIAGFVIVGREIGVLATLGLVLGGVVLGALLLRKGGIEAFSRVRAELQAGRDPSLPLVNGFMTMIAGVLLMVPGFVSDIAGLLILLPPVQHRAWRALKGRINFTGRFPGRGPGRGQPPRPTNVVDLDPSDYTHAPNPNSPRPNSPWIAPSKDQS
ncbi:MAG: membrane protein FxsA [Methylobacterium mesophilicum]|nr:membrane protein FxsA [Methylobacterium mesophilicum]